MGHYSIEERSTVTKLIFYFNLYSITIINYATY
jgi:hypothetical protein